MSRYKIGFSQKIITPQKPMQMGGYAGERISEGTHDELFVKTIVLKEVKTNELFIFASYDLIGIEPSLKREILDSYPLGTSLILFATHTHSGPAIANSVFNNNHYFFHKSYDEYNEFLIQQTIQAINESIQSLDDFKYTITSGKVLGAYSNRQNPRGYINDKITLFNLDTTSSKALIYNFSCHPTILKPNNRLFSKDLLWGVESQLDEEFPFFINGTAGDISTRFTRKSDDYDELLRTGKIISNSINEIRQTGTEKLKKLEIHPFKITLKTKSPQSEKELVTKIDKLKNELKDERDFLDKGAIRILETKIQGYERQLVNSEYLKNHSEIILNCNIIVWDEFLVVTIPGELFSTLSKPLLEKYPNLILATYADDSIGYITDISGYKSNYYESSSSLLEKGQGEALIEEIEKNIKDNSYAT